jgi:integrase
MARSTTGIRRVHQRKCAARAGGDCNCRPTFEASVGSGRTGKLRRSFKTEAAARTWRAEAQVAVNRGELHATAPAKTVREAAAELTAGMESGTIRNRSGDPYKPSVIRSYELSLRLHVLPDLGAIKISKLRRRDVQGLAERLLAAGQDPSTVRNSIKPLRVIYRRAIRAGDVSVNPCMNLDLPAVRGRRDRIVSREQAAELIAALRPDDHALWGTAFYAGLRLGELRALLWSDVDLAGGVIRVERALDQKGATIHPKSVAGVRTVPIPKALRSLFAAHRLQRVGEGYVFGSSLTTPFTASAVLRRARLRWSRIDSLKPLADFGLHEARHTFASLMIDAGVNAKALTEYMGHSSITVTFDRYGHLMPGNHQQAAALLDAYLDGAVRRT